jgi:hypothetical protein
MPLKIIVRELPKDKQRNISDKRKNILNQLKNGEMEIIKRKILIIIFHIVYLTKSF